MLLTENERVLILCDESGSPHAAAVVSGLTDEDVEDAAAVFPISISLWLGQVIIRSYPTGL